MPTFRAACQSPLHLANIMKIYHNAMFYLTVSQLTMFNYACGRHHTPPPPLAPSWVAPPRSRLPTGPAVKWRHTARHPINGGHTECRGSVATHGVQHGRHDHARRHNPRRSYFGWSQNHLSVIRLRSVHHSPGIVDAYTHFYHL